MDRAGAMKWLERRRCEPLKTSIGLYRWSLIDGPRVEHDEFPDAIFNRLEGAKLYAESWPGLERPFPWLYETREKAMEAAAFAVMEASKAGELYGLRLND